MIENEDGSELDKGMTQRQLVHLMYGLFAIGILSAGVFGLAIIAAVILAYLKRSEMVGTVYASHVDWLIRTFWWGLLWLLVSIVLSFVFIGFVTGLLAVVWVLYRLIKGWLAHFAGETPLPGL